MRISIIQKPDNSEDISFHPETIIDHHILKEIISLVKCKVIGTRCKDGTYYNSQNGVPLEGRLNEVVVSSNTFILICAWAVSSLKKEIEKPYAG